MNPALFTILVACLWVAAVVHRAYRQVRFYQIEEYKSARYARYWLSDSKRFLPRRPIVAFGVAAIFALFTDTLPTGVSLTPYLAMSVAALIALVPLSESEVKKPFVRTGRATRILGAAFVTIALLDFLASAIVLQLTDSDRGRALLIGSVGLFLYLLAPLWLMVGNWLMTPVEATLRRRFIARARKVLHDVNPKVIGITGSYGKTTTKNFLRDILNGRYKAYATPKSYNTMMGVCIALNNDVANDYSIDYFISEMGAYVEGEIKRICDLTPPDISIVVDIGPQHLERFGSLENIATAKYEIIKGLRPDGLGIFNYDNAYVRSMFERGYPPKRIAVSKQVDANSVTNGIPRFVASSITETLNGLTFAVTDTTTQQSELFTTTVVGEHNVMNILLATAVAVHEGMSLSEVARRVSSLQPAESRLVRQADERGIVIINDAYSANPVGIVGALQVLGMYSGRRVLITPGMIELGDLHEVENQKLGILAAQHATDIVLVGAKQTEPILNGIKTTAFPTERVHTVNHVREAIDWYRANLQAGDTVLLLNDLPDTY